MFSKITHSNYSRTLCAAVVNIALSFALFFVGRVIFLWFNHSYFSYLEFGDICSLFRGGVVFDLSAMAYINSLYLLLMLLPLHYKESAGYQSFTKWLFVVVNNLALWANIGDTIYYEFSKRRTTMSIVNEFGNDNNIGGVAFDALVDNWYLVAIAAVILYLSTRLYFKPKGNFSRPNYWIYYPLQLLYMLLGTALLVVSMRGGLGADVRPITISNANQYVERSPETAIVLNTPFSLLRTLGDKSFVEVNYLTQDDMVATFSPIHKGATKSEKADESEAPLNVVVLIMESFGREYIGALNRDTDHPSYTPFLDSLIDESLTFRHSFANGLKSIDAMPSILSGIPMFVEPFFLTTSSLNDVSGLAGELKRVGYNTSFFHGASNGSMGFMAFAKATGFDSYYGRDDYNNDDDFDGRWAIWDEEFFQFYAEKLSTFEEPFASAIFSASSHHPFNLPKRYEGKFPEGTVPIHKCIGYSDNALRLFFERIRGEEWFNNTLFVITADHTNLTAYPESMNTYAVFKVPIIFYCPGRELRGYRDTIAEQIDILPTILGYLGYPNDHLAFGRNLLDPTQGDEAGYAVNYYNGTYQYLMDGLLLQFDGERFKALYNFERDPLFKENLLDTGVPQQPLMERRLKAIIQQYMHRMINDSLTAE